MHIWKRLLGLILSLLLICLLLPLEAVQANAEETYMGDCGDNLTWLFDGETGELYIYGEGSMWDFNARTKDQLSNAPWMVFSDRITSIQIYSGVTTIGAYAFAQCWKAVSISIPDTVTSIREYAFYSCRALGSITIPGSVRYIDRYAFSSCDSMENAILQNGIAWIGDSAFSFCSGITSVMLPDTLNYLGDYAFAGCASLTEAMLFNRDTSLGEYALGYDHSDYDYVRVNNFTLYGYTDSTLEYYAYQNGFTFRDYPRIIASPRNASVPAGSTAVFEVAAAGTNLQYHWQYCPAGALGWASLPNATEPTLILTATEEINGYFYRCTVYNGNSYVYSGEAKLTVLPGKPTITTQPKSGTVAAGSNYTFKLVASGSGLSYQWQYKYAGTSTWYTWSGKTAASLTVTGKDANNGCEYRCIVRNESGSVTSSAVRLTVTNAKPAVTAHPGNLSLALTKAGSFKVTAVGSGLTYQWQYSYDNGGTWYTWSGKTAASLSVTGKNDNNGCLYRCIVKNNKGSVTSNSARLTVTDAKPRILIQPKNAVAALGNTVKFQVTAGGSGLSYQWQYKYPYPTSKWINWSGKTTSSLTVTGKETNSNCQYRCIIKNAYGSVTSGAGMITVTGVAPIITNDPASATVSAGANATFKAAASGAGLSYQWQYKYAGTTTWYTWSGKTAASLTVTGKDANNGCEYRCVIKNSTGSVTSAAARLTVTNAKPAIISHPGNLSLALTKTGTFKVTAVGSSLTYQWQYSYDNGSTWYTWSGKTAASLSVTGKNDNNGCLYRCIVKNGKGSVTSKSVRLTVTNAKPRILVQPKNVSVAVGKTVTMKVVAGGSGLSYQWQYKYPKGNWTNWNGQTASTLTITGKTSNGGCQYRCVVKNSYGSATSSAGTLTVS